MHFCISVNKEIWDDQFGGKVGECGVLRNGGMVLKLGVGGGSWYPFTDHVSSGKEKIIYGKGGG